MKHHLLFIGTAVLSFTAVAAAQAQQQPNAGQVIQELRTAPPAPHKAPLLKLATPSPTAVSPGGASVVLRRVKIHGNTVFTSEALAALLADATGKPYKLAGLQQLAERISNYYHQHDYPFAVALIPAQAMKDGALSIQIVEGRYGRRNVSGASPKEKEAQKFLNPLHAGEVIKGGPLERATLILNDQPGYSFTPTIQPGKESGTGDLEVAMKQEPRVAGSVALDNGGNRYTGRFRALASAVINSPFVFGDQLNINGITTNENMWFGSAGYSRPLGYSGLRGNVGFTHTYYELGSSFSALDAHGTADIASMGVSYPLLRSQQNNLTVAATYQHKWLQDKQGSTSTDSNKHSDSLPLALNFDRRDGLLGGGVTYGTLAWTHGALNLDAGLDATDATTAGTKGIFDKLNLDVSRLQALPVSDLVLFVRATGQLAGDNLDSSEDFGLGGPNGVRAYPTGEGFGDSGWLEQAELRYNMGLFTPYLFYDYGQVKANQNAWTSDENQRSLGGGGLGLRLAYRSLQADFTAAWRNAGGEPQSDTQDNLPQLWVSVGYKF